MPKIPKRLPPCHSYSFASKGIAPAHAKGALFYGGLRAGDMQRMCGGGLNGPLLYSQPPYPTGEGSYGSIAMARGQKAPKQTKES